MNVSKITIGGVPATKSFMKEATPEKMGQLIKESVGLAPKGLTTLEAKGVPPMIIPVAKDNFFKVGGLKTVAADLPVPTKGYAKELPDCGMSMALKGIFKK